MRSLLIEGSYAQFSVLYENKNGNSNYKYYCHVSNSIYKPSSIEQHDATTLYFDYSGVLYKGKLTNLVKKIYGIERIPDLMAMVEMEQYTDELNVDRLVALSALIAFAKVQQANSGFKKRTEYVTNNQLENNKKLPTFTKNPFRHMGGPGSPYKRTIRNPYKNLK